ncbi:MAG TPA: right-handed parallel beta-helix repeat-containing protein, partial [Anaerolineales bacterium]|nr:right-handed parallel beta-helix repeat-containing protein [Anaerolineales bacterium]
NNPTVYLGAGTIYVEQGNYGGGESTIDFNAYNLSNISNSNLTIQGGWNPGTGSTPASGDTTTTSNFTVPIIIGSSTNPWGGSVTIDNIIVSDTVDGAGAGLTVHSNANVTITDSKFLRNDTQGAVIRAGGNVAIANSEFSNTFNQRRQVTGLDITSGGSVSLFQVLANGNRRRGADINAAGRVSIGSNLGCTHTVGLATDCSSFSETNGLNGGVFYGFGLRVVTPDAIDLSFVTANNNFLWGADLDAGGDVNITDSVFNANSTLSPTFIDDTGLLVTSGGRVSLNNVQANDNRLIGATIDSVGDISVNNSTFNNNRGVILDAAGNTTYHGLGLLAVSQGSIFVNGVTASGNMLYGAHLDAGGDVDVAGSTFSNQTSTLATVLSGRGLEVVSGGNVFLDNVVMDSNQLFGGSIQAAGDVFLDLNTATNNGDDGLQVESASCTHLNGGTYSGNAQFGLNLVNSPLNVVSPATFGGNGAGDISPATPATCSLVIGGTPLPTSPTGSSTSTSNNINTGSSLGSNSSLSSLVQNVSYNTHAVGTVLPGISLNGMFGITREKTSNSVVTSIFVGNYTYVYTAFEDDSGIESLQIIVVNPPPIQIAGTGA